MAAGAEKAGGAFAAAFHLRLLVRHAPDHLAWRDIERRVNQVLRDLRGLFTGDVTQAREGLRQLLTTPILFTPIVEEGRRGLRFKGTGALGALISGGVVTKMASPEGFEPSLPA